MGDTNSGMSDAGRFFLAVGAALLFALACLAAALGPVNANCTCRASAGVALDRPTLL